MSLAESPTRRLLTLPNAISASRIALTPGVAWAMLGGHGVLAVTGFALVVASDFLDGIVARRARETSAFGTLLDHGADAVFVSVIAALGAKLGLLPVALAPLIVFAFGQYALDSRLAGSRGPRASRLGRFNGIAYYVIAGATIVVHLHAHDYAPATAGLMGAGWLLAATSLASVVDRAVHSIYRSGAS